MLIPHPFLWSSTTLVYLVLSPKHLSHVHVRIMGKKPNSFILPYSSPVTNPLSPALQPKSQELFRSSFHFLTSRSFPILILLTLCWNSHHKVSIFPNPVAICLRPTWLLHSIQVSILSACMHACAHSLIFIPYFKMSVIKIFSWISLHFLKTNSFIVRLLIIIITIHL